MLGKISTENLQILQEKGANAKNKVLTTDIEGNIISKNILSIIKEADNNNTFIPKIGKVLDFTEYKYITIADVNTGQVIVVSDGATIGFAGFATKEGSSCLIMKADSSKVVFEPFDIIPESWSEHGYEILGDLEMTGSAGSWAFVVGLKDKVFIDVKNR